MEASGIFQIKPLNSSTLPEQIHDQTKQAQGAHLPETQDFSVKGLKEENQ